MGNQGTAENGLRDAVEIDPGRRHRRRRARSTSGPTGRSGRRRRDVVEPGPTEARRMPPKHVHWDLFLGPGPERPVQQAAITRSTGAAGGTSAPAPWATWPATPPTWPSWPSSSATRPASWPRPATINPETYPAWATITFEFPARGDMPPVKFTWYEGQQARRQAQNLPPKELFKGEKPVRTAARCWSATRASSTRRTTTAPVTCCCRRRTSRTSRSRSRRCRATARATWA